MDTDNVVMDEPIVDVDAVDTADIVEEPVVTDAAEPVAGEETPESGDKGDQQDDKDPALTQDGRSIPKHIRALKDTNPEGYKKAKADHFELADRRTVHPTMQAARDEHELVESLGGTDGVADMQEKVTFLRDASQQFLKGDPAFVKDLWEEDATAAALHVTPMLEAYKVNDKEGYLDTLSKLFAGEFDGARLYEDGLSPLKELIAAGKKDDAIKVLDSIINWQQTIAQRARKTEDPRVKRLLTERAQWQESEATTQREAFLTTYRTETLNDVVGAGQKVLDSFLKNLVNGKALDNSDKTALLRDAMRIANDAVNKDAAFIKQRDAHLKAGNAKAAQRLTIARYGREWNDAVKRVARRYGAISGSKPNPQQKNNQQQPRTPAVQGFVNVNRRPTQDEVDYGRTRQADIIARRAVLKDGRKVSWAHLVKSA